MPPSDDDIIGKIRNRSCQLDDRLAQTHEQLRTAETAILNEIRSLGARMELRFERIEVRLERLEAA